jgi:hypothetical protein
MLYNMTTWKNERNRLLKLTGQTGKEFNQFVKDSVIFFLTDANYSIQVINDLIKIAYQSKGMNHARLINYLDNLVPFERAKTKDGILNYTRKKKDSVFKTEHEARAWMIQNKDWYQYGKEIVPEAFNLHTSLAKVLKLALKNGKTVEDIQKEVDLVLPEVKAEIAAKKSAGASK